MGDLERAAAERRPSVALLIDVPDFNLGLAPKLKALDSPVVPFVAPMAWAWRDGRARRLSALVDELCCILALEEPFLRARGVSVTSVGSPVLERLWSDPEREACLAGLDELRASLGTPGTAARGAERLLARLPMEPGPFAG